jgi:hypothetical protein
MQTFGLFEQLVQEYLEIRSFNFNGQEYMPKIHIICPQLGFCNALGL